MPTTGDERVERPHGGTAPALRGGALYGGTAPALRGGASAVREGLLLLGFVVVLALALVAVVLPELSREPDSASARRPAQATTGDGKPAKRAD
jgi:hypothetical protein